MKGQNKTNDERDWELVRDSARERERAEESERERGRENAHSDLPSCVESSVPLWR